MKKILMIMYAKTVGGAELQFVELANFLAKDNNVRLIFLGGDGAIRNSYVDPSIEIKIYPYSSIVSTLFGLARAFMTNVLFPSHSIVTTSFIANVLGLVIGKLRRIRIVSLQTVAVCMRHPRMDRFVLSRFDVLIAGAADIKKYLIDHGQCESNIQVVHNWVDFSSRKTTASVEQTKERLGVAGKIVIGCVGRLHPQKGHAFLIQAFNGIANEHKNVHLLLVGNGELRRSLEEQVNQCGLSARVTFTGGLSGSDYNNTMQAIDIYVQPSVFEGLPRTLLDAMYLGNTIVATDINGNREAIEHMQNGILVPPKDPESLALAISKLLVDESLGARLSMHAKQTAEEKFDMNLQLKKIETIVRA